MTAESAEMPRRVSLGDRRDATHILCKESGPRAGAACLAGENDTDYSCLFAPPYNYFFLFLWLVTFLCCTLVYRSRVDPPRGL